MALEPLSKEELIVISNQDFLLTKNKALEKIYQILVRVKNHLEPLVTKNKSIFPKELKTSHAKISKGENYKQLPYVVLDYPAVFHHENIFAYRSMFWWGHYFSATLHLQGAYLEAYRDALIDHLSSLTDHPLYVAVGESPWEYHYDSSNYLPLEDTHGKLLVTHPFIKLSIKSDLSEWKSFPKLAYQTFSLFLEAIGT